MIGVTLDPYHAQGVRSTLYMASPSIARGVDAASSLGSLDILALVVILLWTVAIQFRVGNLWHWTDALGLVSLLWIARKLI